MTWPATPTENSSTMGEPRGGLQEHCIEIAERVAEE